MTTWLISLGLLALTATAADPPAPPERLMLNEATAEELAGVDGIDQDGAAAIVDLRETRGRLSSVEELRVLPLEEEALASLRSRASVEVVVPELPVTSYETVEAVLAEFGDEPSVQQTQAWANDYANMSPNQVRRWLSQSVTFATLPQVQLEYRLRNDFDQGFEYFTADGLSPTLPDEDPFPIADDADQGQTQDYRVRLVWDLDKIVMSSERIRVINEAQDIVKLRDKVLAEVTRLYFERRRLQVERLLAPKADMLARVKEELRLMELTANIDALTGGAFSSALARGPAGG